MEIHLTKHHQAYINNALAALEGQDDLLAMPVNELLANIKLVPEDKRQAVINNAGGHSNHSLFWQVMGPGRRRRTVGRLRRGNQPRLWQLRQLQGTVLPGGDQALRLWLGLARL